MKLSYNGLNDEAGWAAADVVLPHYNAPEISARTKENPVWAHFGIGNIFRIFIGGLADQLIEKGELDRGISCIEAFDFDLVDRIYKPFDNLVLSVTLHANGQVDKKILGSLAEAVKATPDEAAGWERTKTIFRDPGLQMVSFTITEKGYALRGADGGYFPFIRQDIENGPSRAHSAMAIVTAMLYERFLAGAAPLALVSMDNVSKNGQKLRNSVLEIAGAWAEKDLVQKAFLDYVGDERRVSFPWSMIDKITPRPGEQVCEMLTGKGIENMAPITTSKYTYIAPYVNAEAPQYLVVEDNFPNGRPPLEKAGVYMTDRDTVNKSERMKVTVCLNPIHTALCTYACMLNYTFFADCINDPQLKRLAEKIGYGEGLPVVTDPKILSPKAFLDELMTERFPNPYLGDTSARIAVDISQMVGIRFGENIKAYVKRDGSAAGLTAIPLAIAGWLRYLLAVDDNGDQFELSPDPMLDELCEQLKDVVWEDPDSLGDHAHAILANENIFGSDLYEAGVGEKIEGMIREMLAGRGSVRNTLVKYLS